MERAYYLPGEVAANYVNTAVTKAALTPYVATVIEAFGPARVMFATNWPPRVAN